MTNDKDVKMYGRAEYLKIEKPDRLVYTQQFCDEKNEKTSSSSAGADVAGDDADDRGINRGGPDRTRVTVTWEPSRRHDARRAGNVHQRESRHDARLDRVVR